MKLKLCEVYNQTKFFNNNNITKEKIVEILESKKNVRDYAFIEHNKDVDDNGNPKEPHFHIAIRFQNAQDIKYVAEWFGVSENMVSKVKGTWKDMLQYLTHQNAPNKFQYGEEEVVSNFNWIDEKNKKTTKKTDERLEEIINNIVENNYREYNIHSYVSATEYVKYSRQIDLAYKFRDNILRNKEEREMEVIFINGNSGSGKTTYAKQICKDKGFSFFVTSSSNDPLDGYQGQDCIILDDLRGSCFALSDLLKMLDNNTNSSVKSRYRNKVLQCKMLIITSIQNMEDFYRNVFENENEPILQFKRRCKMYIKMDYKTMEIRIFNNKLKDYGTPKVVPNPIYKQYNTEELTEEQEVDYICSMLPGLDNYKEDILQTAKQHNKTLLDKDLEEIEDKDLPF